MPLYRLQTSLQDVSGLPRDQYVNTLHMSAPVDQPADIWTTYMNITNAFYFKLIEYLSPALKNVGHTFKVYRVGAVKGTPPVFDGTWALGGQPGLNDAPYPGEVACCLTFHGDPQAGLPRQSWRGRIYIGPLSAKGAGPVGSAGGRPSQAFQTLLLNSAKTYFQDMNALGGNPATDTDNNTLVIYSRVHNVITPIATVGVDDAWDTQRSRGIRPSKMTIADLDSVNAGGPNRPA